MIQSRLELTSTQPLNHPAAGITRVSKTLKCELVERTYLGCTWSSTLRNRGRMRVGKASYCNKKSSTGQVSIGIGLVAGGHAIVMGTLNAFVHIVMYTYYLIAGLGPQYQKYIWWKKHVTVLQLVSYSYKLLDTSFRTIEALHTLIKTRQNLLLVQFYPRLCVILRQPKGTLCLSYCNLRFPNFGNLESKQRSHNAV